MKRTLLIAVAALGLASSTLLADANRAGYDRPGYDASRRSRHDHHRDHHHDHHTTMYRVLYRHGHHDEWHRHGAYSSHDAAVHAAHDLSHRGYETRIVRS